MKDLPTDPENIKSSIDKNALSELPYFLDGTMSLDIPVYTIYGAAEDLVVIEKFKDGTYKIPNLYLIDESSTYTIKTPEITLRILGLGGSLVHHRLFDHGDGKLTIAGSSGVMWTTVLQMGQLLSTARKCYERSEVRIFVSHPSPCREGLLSQLALALRADYTISSSLHFLYGSSFNSMSAHPSIEHFKAIQATAKAQFMALWNKVHDMLFTLISPNSVQKDQVMLAYETFEAMPSTPILSSTPAVPDTVSESAASGKGPKEKTLTVDFMEMAFQSMWHFNLCDAFHGALVLTVQGTSISSESYSEGFNFEYRLAGKKANTEKVSTAQKSEQLNKNGVATSPNTVPINTSSKARPHKFGSSSPPSQPPAKVALSPKTEGRKESTKPITDPSSSTESVSKDASTEKPENDSAGYKSYVSSHPYPTSKNVPPPQHSIWIQNGQGGEDEVKNFFHEDDRSLIISVLIKNNFNESDKKFAVVSFAKHEDAEQALRRIDVARAGKASRYNPHSGPRSSIPGKKYSSSSGNPRGGPGGKPPYPRGRRSSFKTDHRPDHDRSSHNKPNGNNNKPSATQESSTKSNPIPTN